MVVEFLSICFQKIQKQVLKSWAFHLWRIRCEHNSIIYACLLFIIEFVLRMLKQSLIHACAYWLLIFFKTKKFSSWKYNMHVLYELINEGFRVATSTNFITHTKTFKLCFWCFLVVQLKSLKYRFRSWEQRKFFRLWTNY